MSPSPLPIPPLNFPNTPSSPPVSDSTSTSCNSFSSVPFVELSFNTPYYRTYTPGKGYSGNIAMPAADKFDGCSDDDELDDVEECDDDEDEGSGDEDEDDEHEGSEDDDDDEVEVEGKNGNENAWTAGTARNLWLPHNTAFGETKDAAERQPEDDVGVKTDGADQVEKSVEATSSHAYINKQDDPSKIVKNTDSAYGTGEEPKVEPLNSRSSFARLPVGVETEDIGDLLGDGIEDFGDSSILYDGESNAGESLEGALPTTDTSDLRDLFGEDIGDDIEISFNPPTGTAAAAAAERAIGVQESQAAPTLAELKDELSKIVFKKVDASAVEKRVLEKQRTELVRKITSIQRKLVREKDDAMKVNKTGNLKMPPPDKPDPWSLTRASRPPVGHLTSSKSRSQKRKAEEALDDNMLDTEVLPSMRKRKGRKLNQIEQAMEMAGLYPEDPDREEREQKRNEERASEREREKRQRAWEREERKARKEKERIAKGRESGKGKKKSLWDKWSARMPWETGRWTTQYEKSE